MRRRLVIDVDDDKHTSVMSAGGVFFSTGALPPRLMSRRLVLDFNSDAVCEVIAGVLGLQPVTDREQVLCTAIMMLAIKVLPGDPDLCGQICTMLTEAGFQV